jgi:hypothetical protein
MAFDAARGELGGVNARYAYLELGTNPRYEPE